MIETASREPISSSVAGREAGTRSNYFDGLPLAAPQIMIFMILMLMYFFQQYSNWNFNFLAMAFMKSNGLSGQAANQTMADITSAYFIGMTLGGIAGGLVSDWLGRRKTMLGGMLVLSLASIGSGFANDLATFTIARAITGFGVFALMIATHAYITEMSPAESRGKWCCWVATVGFTAAPVAAILSQLTIPMSPDSWRYVLIFGGVGLLPFFLGIFYIPESPRWLMSKGRATEAEKLVQELTGYSIILPLPKMATEDGKHFLSRLPEMFAPPYRKRSLMLIVLFVTTTPPTFISAFWMPTFYSKIFSMEVTASLMRFISFGVPLGCLLGAFIAERGGRKYSLAATFTLCAIISLAISLTRSHEWLFGLSIVMHICNMASSFILVAYTAEQYPTIYRNSAASIHNGFGRITVSLFQPLVVVWLGSANMGGVFAAFALLFSVAVLPLILYGRKTGGLPLEEASRGDADGRGKETSDRATPA